MKNGSSVKRQSALRAGADIYLTYFAKRLQNDDEGKIDDDKIRRTFKKAVTLMPGGVK